MTKTIIREAIIALLVCLAVLLILSVALYNYIPTNKVVPETVEYSPTKEIQSQLNSAVEDNSSEILMTYEITAQDLDNFERTNQYNPGKANPFAPEKQEENNSNGNSSNGNSNSGNSNNSGSTGNNSSGSTTGTPVTPAKGSSEGKLFEGGSSK